MIKLQISSGQGPCECEAAVGHYLKQLQKEYNSLQVLQSKCGRYKETYTFVICGIDESEIKDRPMTGSILWICPSPYRPNHKRKNWYIDVSLVKEGHELVGSEETGISYQTFRSGGKGGQHVNKVETGVRAIHKETGISVVSTEARSQHMNKQIATSRLLNLLAERNRKSEAEDKKFLWLEHWQIERGNPIRVFKGEAFKETNR